MATNESSVPPPYSVEGKTAIATGAGSGINYCFVQLLLSRGCNVLLADLALRPEAQKLVEQYAEKQEGKPRAVFQKTDVTIWKELEHMFDVAKQEFGTVDIVCPGAGIYDPHWTNFWHPPGTAKSKDAPDSNGYTSIDINMTHPIRTTQLAMAEFLKPNKGAKVSVDNPKRVIIISSIAGQAANLAAPIYVACKHAMNGFIRSLAHLEGELGIRVNGVAPGVIKTPLWTENPEKLKFVDEAKDVWATPEEVAVAMVRCLEERDLGGGTILEVGAGQTRSVAAFNDPGPSGPGHTVSNIRENFVEVYGWLAQDGWGRPSG
ncbi:NAD-dependent 15-hydroxyprostaglandin dehydrogenase [Polyplosphaeria fusca]|uniref:NAD-dependent 15-hydroxyprostaglandin dehydrogenase n=1 Tax=Polyplosphaeria fusca TaxID=682080 RepID=A0A9P4QPB3_9PLEO|nr:NAD-dependent 15-hydroxyprostaglandin dehydrogenase [Polyplosphaeria fusca]